MTSDAGVVVGSENLTSEAGMGAGSDCMSRDFRRASAAACIAQFSSSRFIIPSRDSLVCSTGEDSVEFTAVMSDMLKILSVVI